MVHQNTTVRERQQRRFAGDRAHRTSVPPSSWSPIVNAPKVGYSRNTAQLLPNLLTNGDTCSALRLNHRAMMAQT